MTPSSFQVWYGILLHGQKSLSRRGTWEGQVFRAMKFEVLGPVRGWLGETELELGSPQQRAVLAMLLLAHGRQVPLNDLIDGLWEGDVPRSAAGTVRTYVSRLRRVLGTGAVGRAGCVIISAGDGYSLHLGSAVLDLDQFEWWMRDARSASQRQEKDRSAALLRGALALWRGAAMAGIPGPYAKSRRVRLAELRMAAEQEMLDMDIAAGDYVTAIAELRSLLADHPFQESLSESLMLALYRAGRQADALTVYDTVRRGLREELGVDPGPALQEMYQRILRADDRLVDPAEEYAIA
jgi:DNA-binding SARP family transcriptional activator